MLFRRNKEERELVTYTLKDEEFAKFLGIEIDGVSSDKMKEATYYTCMRILCESVSKLPLKLHQETEDGVAKATDHYLYNILKLRPNPYMSTSTFWKFVEFQRNEYGHSVVYVDTVKRGRHAGRVKALYPLNMNFVEVWIDDAGLIGNDKGALWYVYNDQNGTELKVKDENALHFMGGLTGDGLMGMSVKDYLKTLIENAQSGQSFVNNYFKNGLFAKGLLQYTGDISQDKSELMRQKFEQMANGVKNAGRILPVPLGFSFETINNTMADSQFLELNQLTIQQIAAAFGVKMHQINSLERATHTNIYEQQREFYVDTLQPILTMYEQELTHKLLTEKEKKQGYFFKFNVDSILRSSPKERAEYLKIMREAGFITTNEGRLKEDYPRIDHKNADTPIMNGNAIPLDMVGQQYIKDDSTSKGGEGDE